MGQYRRSLYAEYAVCVGHQLKGGQKKNMTRHSRIRDRSRLMFAAWMQMIIIDGQLCPWKDIRRREEKKKRWKRSPQVTFR